MTNAASESSSSIFIPGEEDAEPSADGGREVWTKFTPSLADENAAVFSQAVEKLADIAKPDPGDYTRMVCQPMNP